MVFRTLIYVEPKDLISFILVVVLVVCSNHGQGREGVWRGGEIPTELLGDRKERLGCRYRTFYWWWTRLECTFDVIPEGGYRYHCVIHS